MSDNMPAVVSDEEWAAAHINGQWTPLTMPAAEWAARKLSGVEDDIDAIKTEISEYVTQVKEWAEERLRTGRAAELLQSKAILEQGLKAYALHQRAVSPLDKKGEPTVKTVKLPSAELRTRKGADEKIEFVIVDMDVVVKWAEVYAPDLVEKSVDPKKLKLFIVVDEGRAEHIINGDGELVPGVDWTSVDAKEPTCTIELSNRERF